MAAVILELNGHICKVKYLASSIFLFSPFPFYFLLYILLLIIFHECELNRDTPLLYCAVYKCVF